MVDGEAGYSSGRKGSTLSAMHPSDPVFGEEGFLYGLIKFEASARLKRQRLIKISAKYFLSYHVAGGCDQASADLFLDRVGRLAADPYFRALVGNLGAQAGAQLPVLPILSFQPRGIHYAIQSEAQGGATAGG